MYIIHFHQKTRRSKHAFMAPSTAASCPRRPSTMTGPSPAELEQVRAQCGLGGDDPAGRGGAGEEQPVDSSCSTMAAPTSPRPWTTLSTPGGSPASSQISATMLQHSEENSDELPDRVAGSDDVGEGDGGYRREVVGVMTPTTPSGRWARRGGA